MRKITPLVTLIVQLCLILVILANPAWADGDSADPNMENRDFDLGAAIGFNAGPTNVAGAIFGDVYVSRFLSAKALSQLGFWQGRTFYTLTVGGEFHFPLDTLQLPQVEFNFLATTGYFLRREGGLSFHNFIFTTGPGVDVYLGENLALTTMLLVNVSNDPVRDIFYSGFAGAKIIF